MAWRGWEGAPLSIWSLLNVLNGGALDVWLLLAAISFVVHLHHVDSSHVLLDLFEILSALAINHIKDVLNLVRTDRSRAIRLR